MSDTMNECMKWYIAYVKLMSRVTSAESIKSDLLKVHIAKSDEYGGYFIYFIFL